MFWGAAVASIISFPLWAVGSCAEGGVGDSFGAAAVSSVPLFLFLGHSFGGVFLSVKKLRATIISLIALIKFNVNRSRISVNKLGEKGSSLVKPAYPKKYCMNIFSVN